MRLASRKKKNKPAAIAGNAPAAPLTPWPEPGSLTVMTRSEATESRKRLRDAYGKEFAGKCSEGVVKALAMAGVGGRRAFDARESADAATAAPRAMVLEFSPPARTGGIAPLGRGGRTLESEAFRAGARQIRIASLRDQSLHLMAAVCAHLETTARRTFGELREGLGAPATGISVVEVCWLNNSVRSRVPPRMLAEVAGDKTVEMIDMPRRIVRELDVSAATVGGPVFRARFGRTGKGIVVAVIDSEADRTHPALAGRVIQAKDFTVEGFGNPDSHGTGVAGIIGGRHPRFQGVAPDAVIRNYKVMATNPANDSDDFGAALALQTALEEGAHIANCSWGVGPVGTAKSREAKAVDAAWENGMVVIKSAGNKGPGAATVTSPADADGVIVVGATDRQGSSVQSYSSRGAANGKARPHLVAPGGSRAEGVQSCLPGGGFGGHTGTSFAAPHVAGLAALLLEHQPDSTPDQIRAALIAQCRAFTGNRKNIHGAGLVSLARFV